jgi:hypothetical protein
LTFFLLLCLCLLCSSRNSNDRWVSNTFCSNRHRNIIRRYCFCACVIVCYF